MASVIAAGAQQLLSSHPKRVARRAETQGQRMRVVLDPGYCASRNSGMATWR
jgi:hypothetical protein